MLVLYGQPNKGIQVESPAFSGVIARNKSVIPAAAGISHYTIPNSITFC